jgi:hypothetical protein
LSFNLLHITCFKRIKTGKLNDQLNYFKCKIQVIKICLVINEQH